MHTALVPLGWLECTSAVIFWRNLAKCCQKCQVCRSSWLFTVAAAAAASRRSIYCSSLGCCCAVSSFVRGGWSERCSNLPSLGPMLFRCRCCSVVLLLLFLLLVLTHSTPPVLCLGSLPLAELPSGCSESSVSVSLSRAKDRVDLRRQLRWTHVERANTVSRSAISIQLRLPFVCYCAPLSLGCRLASVSALLPPPPPSSSSPSS